LTSVKHLASSTKHIRALTRPAYARRQRISVREPTQRELPRAARRAIAGQRSLSARDAVLCDIGAVPHCPLWRIP
jgi:hypothetical protein